MSEPGGAAWPTPRTRKVVGALLVAYLCLMLWVLLRSSPALGTDVAYRIWLAWTWLGAPETWAMFVWAEFAANVALLVPPGLMATIIWPRPTWRDWTSGVFLFSLGVEFIQAGFLADRVATWSDVVANTLGGFIGAILGVLLGSCLTRWRRRRAEPLP